MYVHANEHVRMLVDRCMTWTCSHSLESLKKASTSFAHDENLHWRPLHCHQRCGDLSYVLESAFHWLECEFVRHCNFIPHYDLAPEVFLCFAFLVLRDNAVRRLRHCRRYRARKSVYFLRKTKWRTVVFLFFVARSSVQACLRTSPPRGHSTVGVPKRCQGFVTIWLRACEEFADNRFQLLFIYR